MAQQSLRLLTITDLHYEHSSAEPSWPPSRHCDRGCDLLAAALDDAGRRGGFDAVALLGDLTNDGASEWADQALRDIRETLWRGTQRTKERSVATAMERRRLAGRPLCEANRRRQPASSYEDTGACSDVPILVVPGNHDVAAERLLRAFDDHAGVHEWGGYRLVTFADPYAEGDICTRRDEDLAILDPLVATDGGPLIVLQHNPMNPEIPLERYPFMLTNRDAIMAGYSRAGVLLSISGHYHPGQQPSTSGAVNYFTVPSLCEAPHRYAIITLSGRDVTIDVAAIGGADA